MSLTIINLKPILKKNGESMLDLTYPSIRFNYSPTIINVVSVDEKMEMRPDLISRAAYGIESLWDMILKYNGMYSNPFSICKEDTFLIPDLSDMQEQLAPDGKQDMIGNTIRKQYTDVSKKAQNDPRIAKAEKLRRAAQSAQATIGIPSVSNLPPNIAEIGDEEIVIKGGKVYFGPNISKHKQDCDVNHEIPLSKSEFMAKLIKNRIKNGK